MPSLLIFFSEVVMSHVYSTNVNKLTWRQELCTNLKVPGYEITVRSLVSESPQAFSSEPPIFELLTFDEFLARFTATTVSQVFELLYMKSRMQARANALSPSKQAKLCGVFSANCKPCVLSIGPSI